MFYGREPTDPWRCKIYPIDGFFFVRNLSQETLTEREGLVQLASLN